MKLSEGDSIEHYQVLGALGAGAMGAVYRVLDRRFNVERALKLIKLPDLAEDSEIEAYRDRFFREAQTLASLHVPLPHPNIIQVIDMGELHGIPWFTMQAFPGVSLTEWLDRRPRPSPDRALHVMRQLTAGLAHAHARGVKHRDIKLGNALVSETEGDHAVLIDFGIAKADHHENLTMTGAMSGTETYMAPEYLVAGGRGEAKHTEQTDLWALGCVFYALIVGRRAFDSEPNYQQRIIHGRYTPVLEAKPNLDPVFARVVTDLLQVDPAKRLKSAAELRSRLEEVVRTIDPSKPAAKETSSTGSSGATPRSVPVQNFKLVKADLSKTDASGPKLVTLVGGGRPVAVQSEDDPFAVASSGSVSKSLSAVAMQPVDDEEDLFGTAMPPSKAFRLLGPGPARKDALEDEPTPALPVEPNTFLRAIDSDVEFAQAPVVASEGKTGAPVAILASDEGSVVHAAKTDFGPKVKVDNNKGKQAARRTLVLVVGVVGVVVGLGVAYNSVTFIEPGQPTSFVAPGAVKQEEDGRAAIAALERRKAEQEAEDAQRATALGALRARDEAAALLPAKGLPAPETVTAPAPVPTGPRRGTSPATTPVVMATAPSPAAAPVGRYGARTSGNTASITAPAPAATTTNTTAAVKGIRIPVRLKAAATSAPGPIIAIVLTETQVGTLRIPANTEIHGSSSGTTGPRLNITFSNAIIGGRNVAVRGSAFASDNRGGLPGTRSLGNGSEAATRAAQAVATGGSAALADAVGLAPLADGIRAGADSTTRKADRLNTEEDLLTVPAGVRFSVYVEGLQ